MPFKLKENLRFPSATRRGGFTLIEAFVAITILLVAVLGPLTLLVRAIADGNYAKNQVVATYLLQEGLDLITARAMNLSAGGAADFAGAVADKRLDYGRNCRSAADGCVIYWNGLGVLVWKDTGSANWVLLRYNDRTTGDVPYTYSYNSDIYTNGRPTIFKRRIWFEDIADPQARFKPGLGQTDNVIGQRAVIQVDWSDHGLTRTQRASTLLYE